MGDRQCFVGFAGEDYPNAVFPTVIGQPRFPGLFSNEDLNSPCVGDQAEQKRSSLRLMRGDDILHSVDNLELIWSHIFNNVLHVAPDEHPILFTEPLTCPNLQKHWVANLMFDHFRVPAIYPAHASVLALFATGRTSGIVLNVGQNMTSVLPVYEGYELHHQIRHFEFGSKDLMSAMQRLLEMNECHGIHEDDLFSLMSHHMVVAQEYHGQCIKRSSRSGLKSYDQYLLHCMDDTTVGVPYSILFQVSEMLFNFGSDKHFVLSRKEFPGCHQAIAGAIQNAAIDVRSSLLANIVVRGMPAKIEGFAERLSNEMKSLFPERSDIINVNSADSAETPFPEWTGGSIFASLESFEAACMTPENMSEYLRTKF
jgi:actin-related protein